MKETDAFGCDKELRVVWSFFFAGEGESVKKNLSICFAAVLFHNRDYRTDSSFVCDDRLLHSLPVEVAAYNKKTPEEEQKVFFGW